ncbi:MAG: hypothetical protein ACYTGL_22130 [Planctomycetota bacterium]|jgi:hypothetical protein
MLISSLQDIVRELRRPAKRRSRAVTVEFQNLEPRLFLSVNSLLSSVESSDDSSDNSDTASVDIASAMTAIEDSGSPDAGIVSSSTQTDPNFASVSGGFNANGNFVTGTVEWPDNPTQIEGLLVEVVDVDNLPIGIGYTDANGGFTIEGIQESYVTVRLYNLTYFEIADVTSLYL